MIINVAKSAGFCFGVKRAIKIAAGTAKTRKKVYMLGDIVHNEEVVKSIEKSGIIKISRLTKGKDKILLIRAHGAPLKTYKNAKRLGFTIVDATCPMVKEIHTIAKDFERKGCKIIVIGDKTHQEVKGIAGQIKSKPVIIGPSDKIPLAEIKKIKKAAALVQSTQRIDTALSIVGILREHIRNFKFFNTICATTRQKQKEIKNMPPDNDVMLIIGSKASANTKRLYEISKSLNNRSYWIQSEKDINPGWFKNANSVGITAGASTPDRTTKKVVEYLRKL